MKIMLACNAGMSTSLVVSKMQKEAVSQGKDYTIWAVDQDSIENEVGNFDVLLLGPQIGHLMGKIKSIVGEVVPVATIKLMDYGRCDGPAVLKYAEDTYSDFKQQQ